MLSRNKSRVQSLEKHIIEEGTKLYNEIAKVSRQVDLYPIEKLNDLQDKYGRQLETIRSLYDEYQSRYNYVPLDSKPLGILKKIHNYIRSRFRSEEKVWYYDSDLPLIGNFEQCIYRLNRLQYLVSREIKVKSSKRSSA